MLRNKVSLSLCFPPFFSPPLRSFILFAFCVNLRFIVKTHIPPILLLVSVYAVFFVTFFFKVTKHERLSFHLIIFF